MQKRQADTGVSKANSNCTGNEQIRSQERPNKL
jgi:hypothetical protein